MRFTDLVHHTRMCGQLVLRRDEIGVWGRTPDKRSIVKSLVKYQKENAWTRTIVARRARERASIPPSDLSQNAAHGTCPLAATTMRRHDCQSMQIIRTVCVVRDRWE